MIRLHKLGCILILSLLCSTLIGQQNGEEIFVSKGALELSPEPKISDARVINSSNSNSQLQSLVSQSFLDANNGFIGLVFSDQVTKPNIYFKVVDKAGNEVYNGSSHSAAGVQATLYYNTENLPKGEYRMFVENEDFFMSTSFVK